MHIGHGAITAVIISISIATISLGSIARFAIDTELDNIALQLKLADKAIESLSDRAKISSLQVQLTEKHLQLLEATACSK